MMIDSILSPCLNCTDRHIGCHSDCERYANFKQAMNEKDKDRQKYFKAHPKTKKPYSVKFDR